ncbi:MAG: phage holin family protein [Syntrophales bacterium]
MERNKDSLSLGDLFNDLADGFRTLMRDEIELARLEISRKATALSKDLVLLAVGAAAAYAGLLAVVASFALILAGVFPPWLSALAAGIVVSGIGYIFVRRALGNINISKLTPGETIETIKEDVEWAKDKISGR